MSDKKQTGRSFGSMGYYIALILGAAAIGISGYLYYQNATEDDPQLRNPTENQGPGNEQDLPVHITEDPNDVTRPSSDSTKPTLTEPTVLQTCMPVTGETVMPYAMDVLCYNETTRDWRVHNGWDIEADTGTAVCAAADGTVYTVYDDEQMGQTVVILHDGGYTTRYSSLADEPVVTPGQTVRMGQTIGYVGSTALMESALGDHVHFSVTRQDAPVDPGEFLDQE